MFKKIQQLFRRPAKPGTPSPHAGSIGSFLLGSIVTLLACAGIQWLAPPHRIGRAASPTAPPSKPLPHPHPNADLYR